MHAESAIAATAHAFADGAVASVMNGVGNEEALARHVERVIRGTTFPAGKLLEPGVVQWDVKGDTTFGPFEPQPATHGRGRAPGRRLHARRACPPTPSPTRARRSGARSSSTRPRTRSARSRASRTGASASGPTCARSSAASIDEGKAVASAQGITLDADPEALIDHAAKPEVAYNHKASMLQDVEARRRTEIDYLNGGIVALRRAARRPDAAQRDDRRADPRHRGVLDAGDDDLMDLAQRARAPLRQHARRDGGARPRRADRRRAASTAASRAASRTSPGSRSCTATPTSSLPADGEPFIVFPTEARYVGEHGTTALEQVFADRPGAEIAARAQAAGWKRIGVFGLDYIMNVRDHSALERPRPRALRRRVRPLARGQEQGRARVGARFGAHQPARLRDLLRRLRAGQQRGRGDGRRRGLLRERGLRPADR